MNERFIRISHIFLMSLTLIFGIISLGVSAYLVAKYADAPDKNKEYPHHRAAYRDRTRIILTGSVWTTFWALILTVGFNVAGHNPAFGILTHLLPMLIAFLLMIIGVGALTGLTSKISCGNAFETFERCRMMKTLVAVGWIDTIFIFAFLIFLIALAFKARAWGGVRHNTLYID